MKQNVTRRLLILAGLGGGAALGLGTFSYFATPKKANSDALTLGWEDLVPQEQRDIVEKTLNELEMMNDNNLSNSSSIPEINYSMVNDYDEKVVRIPGFMVPVGFEGDKVSEFLLVPFIGACVHVPPPPPNQLVLVQPQKPFLMVDNWDPVYAVGKFKSSNLSTELAQVGYVMWEADIEPYEEEATS